MDALVFHRWQFGFTIAYHYLFPQLTMGLALLIVVLKTMALRGDEAAGRAARFWVRIFGVSFLMGVVTGIPMEFQFGTNWSRFAAAAGGVIGQTLAMEGVFAFFLEATFLYFLLYGERQLGPRGHWVAAVLVFAGSWLSGYFIVCTNAWMQHPVGYSVGSDGALELQSLGALLTNPWALAQYAHVMTGAAITGSFAMASIGSFYLLQGRHADAARRFVAVSVVAGLAACVLAIMPTGSRQAELVHDHQPITFAAMEGLLHTERGADMVLIGQPNMKTMRLDNPIVVPDLLSFLVYDEWTATVDGLSSYPKEEWPDQVPLLYYSYHVMAGLGTMFLAVMAIAAILLWRGRLYRARWLLWILMLALPFPFVANTAGWMTAELGRQPWVIHGLLRTADASSENVSSGNALFSLIGFMGLYALLSVVCLFVLSRMVSSGPDAPPAGRGEHA